ncbi:MAG: DUF4263 domain-containing protein [Candidatus Latescibacteria bacterium]|nr:DUF4263 domain-containing protein [Candidatus Latescibacterota bacterium]
MLERTYHIKTPPEPAIEWNAYEKIIYEEWNDLLNRESNTENDLQSFFERHPSMLPGAFQLIGNESGHYPWFCGVISQPILPSYDRRIPDFMWLSMNSCAEEPVLIEIENTNKRWFTKKGNQSAQLTQALNQIAEWKAWFSESRNVEAFKAFYGLDRESWYCRQFHPSYLLIYGRKKEANANTQLTTKRYFLQSDDVIIMTYDRLRPNQNASQLVSMKLNQNGYKALEVPPTIKWSPILAKERALLSDLDNAILSNKYISKKRKDFLVRRLPYWNEWAKKIDTGLINAADVE